MDDLIWKKGYGAHSGLDQDVRCWAFPSDSAADQLSDPEQVTHWLWALVLILIQNVTKFLPALISGEEGKKNMLDEFLKKYGGFIFPFL